MAIQGYLDAVDPVKMTAEGWAADNLRPTVSIGLVVSVDGVDITGAANTPRADVTRANPTLTGNHGFVMPLPAKYADGKPHVVRAYGLSATGAKTELANSPKTLLATVAPPQPPTGVDAGTMDVDWTFTDAATGRKVRIVGTGTLKGTISIT